MAKAYRTLRDLSIPLVVGRDEDGGNEVTQGEAFVGGAIVRTDQLSKFHQKQLEDGKLDDLFEPVSDEEADSLSERPNPTGEPEHGIFFPEHEAERVALQIGGHLTVPKEQELELLSQDEERVSAHMAEVKEKGLDRREVQEHMAGIERRIDPEVLQGGQTAAGMPHNRGPEQEQRTEPQGEAEDAPAARPNPTRQSNGEGQED